MRLQLRRLMYMAVLGLCVASCTLPAEPDNEGTKYPNGYSPPGGPGNSPTMAMVHFDTIDLTYLETLEKFAKADVVCTQTSTLWSPVQNYGVVDALKERNPQIKVLGYINAHGSWLQWGDDPEQDPVQQPYGWDWYQATLPYWSYTTTGDTMMAWPGQVLLNILDPDCRAAMINVIAAHQDQYSNKLDGFFWDHFNQHLWVPAEIPGVEGDMDLDGDGIPHRDDEDEMQAYRDASTSMVQEFSSVMGAHVIQIANGNRAATDSNFAALVDGMFYEHFPQVGYWGQEMVQVFDPNVSNNIFAARNWPRSINGGPWLIFANKHVATFIDSEGDMYAYRQAEFARVVALMAGTAVCYNPYDETYHYSWPEVELHLGNPLGGVERQGDTMARQFENGYVTLTMTTGQMPFPFNFEIVQDGEVVQSFAFPAHYP